METKPRSAHSTCLALIILYPPKKSYPFRTGNVESRRGDFYPILDPHRIPDSILLRRVKLSGPRSVQDHRSCRSTPSSMMLYHHLKTTFPDVYTSRTMIAAPSVVRLILKYRPPGLYLLPVSQSLFELHLE